MAKPRLRKESACKCSICEVEGPSAKKAEVPVSASSQMARLLGRDSLARCVQLQWIAATKSTVLLLWAEFLQALWKFALYLIWSLGSPLYDSNFEKQIAHPVTVITVENSLSFQYMSLSVNVWVGGTTWWGSLYQKALICWCSPESSKYQSLIFHFIDQKPFNSSTFVAWRT
jgi:hypothetical protein